MAGHVADAEDARSQIGYVVTQVERELERAAQKGDPTDPTFVLFGQRPTTFSELARSRPNAGPNPPRRYTDWNSIEAAELETEVAPVAEALGYEYRARMLLEQSIASGVEREGMPRLSLPTVLKQLFG